MPNKPIIRRNIDPSGLIILEKEQSFERRCFTVENLTVLSARLNLHTQVIMQTIFSCI